MYTNCALILKSKVVEPMPQETVKQRKRRRRKEAPEAIVVCALSDLQRVIYTQYSKVGEVKYIAEWHDKS